MTGEERRRFPRIADASFSMELRAGEFDVIIHTLNISASGVYCKIDREIPLMSRVRLVLMLPGLKNDSTRQGGIEVGGVVVREHPVVIDGKIKHYDLAIFFDDIASDDRKLIASYLASKET